MCPRQLQKLAPRKQRFAPAAALGIETLTQELDERHARNLDRILETQEQPGGGAFVGGQSQQIQIPFASSEVERPIGRVRHRGVSTSLDTNGWGECGSAPSHLIPGPPAQHIGQRRFARAIRPHDRMNLARIDAEREALEDRLVGDRGEEVIDLEH